MLPSSVKINYFQVNEEHFVFLNKFPEFLFCHCQPPRIVVFLSDFFYFIIFQPEFEPIMWNDDMSRILLSDFTFKPIEIFIDFWRKMNRIKGFCLYPPGYLSHLVCP